MAEIGGLLGLFMGCSLLSIVELFFFCVKTCLKKRAQVVDVERTSNDLRLDFHTNHQLKLNFKILGLLEIET